MFLPRTGSVDTVEKILVGCWDYTYTLMLPSRYLSGNAAEQSHT